MKKIAVMFVVTDFLSFGCAMGGVFGFFDDEKESVIDSETIRALKSKQIS